MSILIRSRGSDREERAAAVRYGRRACVDGHPAEQGLLGGETTAVRGVGLRRVYRQRRPQQEQCIRWSMDS